MGNNKNSNIPVWAIVLGFILFWPVGMVLLFLHLGGVSIPLNKAYPAVNKASSAVHNMAHNHVQAQKKPLKKGTFPTILGSILAAVGLIRASSEILTFGLSFPTMWFPPVGLACGGLALMGFGIAQARLARRFRLYQGAIGPQKSIYICDLANAAGISEKKVIADLEKLLSSGVLPIGYIDRKEGRLVLSDQGFQSQHKPKPEAQPKQDSQTNSNQDDAILHQIRAVNDAIPDPVMSAKIDRIEEITRRILDYQRQNPSKAPQLRQFLNYYLPTTLRLLKTYANLDAQGVNGTNITAAKIRIEGMMDKVVEGFEKQLDQLFQTDAMDIAADVEVLEQMLEKDGLGGDGMMTM